MARPRPSIVLGIPSPSWDGKYYARYPRGDKPGNAGELAFVVSSYQGFELTDLTFTVSRTNGSVGAIAVDWEIGSLSEGAPNTSSGTFTWADGESGSKQKTVTLGTVTQQRSGVIVLSNARSTSGQAVPSITLASASLTINNDSTAPGPVTLTATPTSSASISLHATGGADAQTGFRRYIFERSPNGTSGWTQIASQAASDVNDGGRTPDTQYFYRCRAEDWAGNFSSYASANARTSPVTVSVANVTQLNAAIEAANVNGYTQIVLADGTYTIGGDLPITGHNITIRSQSGNRQNVIVRGDAMSADASVGNIFRVSGNGFTLQDLTVGRCRWSAVQLAPDNGVVDRPTIRNCVLEDTYEHFIKGAIVGSDGSSNGIVEDCLFRYTAGIAPNYYTGGIDVHRGSGWTVRRNAFRDIASPSGSAAQHAVNFWNGSTNNLIERNRVIDCDRGIGSGLSGNPSNDGDVIRNNMVYHSANAHPFADVGISVENSTNAKVYNNTVFLANSFDWCMEYRFGTAGTEFRNNLTNKQIFARDGGTAALSNNVTNAQSNWFVDVASGDLRLASSIGTVVDAGVEIEGLTEDFEGDSRPQGPAIDIGADEYIAPTTDPTSLPLMQLSDINYLGSFEVPTHDGGSGEEHAFEWGGCGLAVHPDGQSLYFGGHEKHGKAARISIPEIGGMASVIQPLTTVPGNMGDNDDTRIGGLMVWNNRLIITKYLYYGGADDQNKAALTSALNLTGFTAPQVIGTLHQRYVAGPICVIPEAWRALLGGPCAAGQGLLSRIDSTSAGPAFTVFDPDQLGGSGSITGHHLLYYELSSSRRLVAGDSQNDYFVYGKSNFAGIIFPEGTRSVLFVFNHGTGPVTYGVGGDPCFPDKGYHAYPYRYQALAYDANDLLAVKLGAKQPWELRPYAVFVLPPLVMGDCASAQVGGGTYDHATRRFYFCEYFYDAPRTHVFQIGTPS